MAQTNLAVDKVTADKIRSRAKRIGATTYDVTNQLLEYGLRYADLRIETKIVTFKAVELDAVDDDAEPEEQPAKRGRGRPPKK